MEIELAAVYSVVVVALFARKIETILYGGSCIAHARFFFFVGGSFGREKE